MSKLILIQDDDWERQYRESMEWLNHKYHDQPTHLRPIPANDDGGYNTYIPQRNQHRITPNGKKVI